MPATKKPLPQLQRGSIGVTLGCDPELFFRRDGQIIGAEKILPKAGLNNDYVMSTSPTGKTTIDGVQLELNPLPSGCRQSLSYSIQKNFQRIKERLDANPGVTLSFENTVEVTEQEMMTLSPENQMLGCSPSENTYNKRATTGVKNPSKFFTRSAGGHIHLGSTHIKGKEARIVRILDIILGNTMVLIDRDPGNAIRRKTYGRAGEYRAPKHGVEYRTLSNFWLRNYTLASLVFGIARYAVDIVCMSRVGQDYERAILRAVDRRDIIKAINTNDFDLALKNYKAVAKVLAEISGQTDRFPLSAFFQPHFMQLVNDGLDKWFTVDPLKSWLNLGKPGYFYGWEEFCHRKLDPAMKAAAKAKAEGKEAPVKRVTRRATKATTSV